MCVHVGFWDWRIGDIATWVAAFGTIAAVGWAIYLAGTESRNRRNDAYARARVMASFLFTEIGLLNVACDAVIGRLEEAKKFTDGRAFLALEDARAKFDRTCLRKIEENLERLTWLPPSHAVGFAALPDMKRVIQTILDPGSNTLSVQSIHDACDRGLTQLKYFKRCLTDFLGEFEPQFAT